MSVVVAAFFSGLALGSWRFGLRADRWRHLLRSYALLELSLGCVSALVTLLLSQGKLIKTSPDELPSPRQQLA